MKIVFWICSLLAICLAHSETLEEKELEEKKFIEQYPEYLVDRIDFKSYRKNQHPLKKFQKFHLLCSVFCPSVNVKKQVETAMQQELEKLGKIVLARIGDFRDFPPTNFLCLKVGNIEDAENKTLPLIRLRLCVETSVDLINTKNNDLILPVWSTNTYVEGNLNDATEADEKLLAAVRKLVDQFIKNYQFANPNQKKPPGFYDFY